MDKKGAMELSVGTIVVIVLMMTVLVLGIFFIQKIFSTGSNAVDSIDSAIQSEIEKLFGGDSDREFVIYPTSRRITLEQGSSNKGFAFSIRNIESTPATFSWEVSATDVSKCPGVTEEMATDWVLGGTGSVENLASGAILEARLVTLIIPQSAPLCTLDYTLTIQRGGATIAAPNIAVNIE